MSKSEDNANKIKKFDENLADNLRNDSIYKQYFGMKRNLSEASIKLYNVILKDYCYAIKMLPSEFIKEAKEEQEPYTKKVISPDGEEIYKFVEPDMASSQLQKHFNDYYDYMVDKNLVKKTRNHRFRFLRGFYYQMGVKNLPKQEKETEEINKVLVLSRRQIKNGIDRSKLRNKSIITLAVSTGFRGFDLRHFKVKDGLKALGIRGINELKKLNWEKVNIVGYWEFVPHKTKRTSLICQGCNTPEASRYMVKYLQERINNGEELTLESPLFATRNGFISEARFVRIFTNLDEPIRNDELAILKAEYEKGIITEEEYELGKENIPYFHNHGLREYFISVLATKCPNIRVAVKLEAHKSPVKTDVHYVGVSEEEIREEYMKLIPYLSFDNSKVNILTDKRIEEYEKEIAELKQDLIDKDNFYENRIEELENQVKKVEEKVDTPKSNKYNPKIKRVISRYAKEKLDIDNLYNKNTLTDLVAVEIVAYNMAINDEMNFKDSNSYLDRLVKKAQVEYNLDPKKYEEEIEKEIINRKSKQMSLEDIYNKLIKKLGAMNILEIYPNLTDDELEQMVKKYLTDNREYIIGEPISDDSLNSFIREMFIMNDI